MKKKNFNNHPQSYGEIKHAHDPLEDTQTDNSRISERTRQKARKPDEPPKKIRSGPKESYRPLGRR